jgi:acetyltransferase
MPLPPRTPGRFHPECLFRPGSVAVIGAQTGAGAQVIGNLLTGGFKGPVLPVAPGHQAVAGVLAYPDIATLPVAPDLAVLAVDAAEVPAAIRALGSRGTHAAIVTGMGGGLRALAHETGVRSLGPGSFGIAVPGIGLNASRAHLKPRQGHLALVSQSAALCRAVIDWAEPNGVGFSHIVGIGGNDDIGFGIVLDWLSRDPGTGAILLDVRRIKDRRAFLSTARAAARLRPMVALRAGGLLLDPSGDADATFTAALRRAGVLCVPALEDLLAAAETLTRSRPARGEDLAIIGNAIGAVQLAADAALRDGLRLADLGEETKAAINAALPGAFAPPTIAPVALGNLVYADLDSPAKLAEGAMLLAAAREVGGVLIVHAPTGAADTAAIDAIATATSKTRVPLLSCVMGETTAAAHRRRLAEAGLPVFATPEQAVRGFLHLVQDRRNRAAARELPASTVLRLAPDRAEVAKRFARTRSCGRLMLTQEEATAVCAAYGIPTVPGRTAIGAEDAAHAAAVLGFPAVLKRRRLDRPDPAQHGGLAFDLRDTAAVRAAAHLLERRAAVRNGDPIFIVQRQVGRARELSIRVAEDPVFGPTIGFGQGGTAAQIVRDMAIDLPPLNLTLARALIARTRVAATLGPLPDQPAVNVEPIADALVRVSQLLVDFPEIAELEINPLFADADGVLAADAWIRLRSAGEEPARLAIPPYPAELTHQFDAGGELLTIRPIRPEDAAAHAELFKRLPPEDIRYRFFTAIRELSAEQMARLTNVDYDREIAFIAVREATGETVGVSRLVREGIDGDGEFAVLVQPDMKHRHLAQHLMERLIDWARAQGMTEIVGQVLADNAPMLAFVRHLGFTVRRMPGESEVLEARLAIAADLVSLS